jgi:hypothetical protein
MGIENCEKGDKVAFVHEIEARDAMGKEFEDRRDEGRKT